MGGSVPPQLALFWIILSKQHHLHTTMFGNRWREKRMPRQFPFQFTNPMEKYLHPLDSERGHPHKVRKTSRHDNRCSESSCGWKKTYSLRCWDESTAHLATVAVRWPRDDNFNFELTCQCNILTSYNVERSQQHTTWWEVVIVRKPCNKKFIFILNYLTNEEVLTVFSFERSQQHIMWWTKLPVRKSRHDYNLWHILSMQHYLHTVLSKRFNNTMWQAEICECKTTMPRQFNFSISNKLTKQHYLHTLLLQEESTCQEFFPF
jgi:hypothetical protein